MSGSFAYSFDRDTFTGGYATRAAALAAAGRALVHRAEQPAGIFVGQWAEPDPQASGHAEALIGVMRDRFAAATGDDGYLAGVTDQQAAGLDDAVRDAVVAWLARHDLTPRATRVHAVSEHPVPNVHHVDVPAGERETSLIGEA